MPDLCHHNYYGSASITTQITVSYVLPNISGRHHQVRGAIYFSIHIIPSLHPSIFKTCVFLSVAMIHFPICKIFMFFSIFYLKLDQVKSEDLNLLSYKNLKNLTLQRARKSCLDKDNLTIQENISIISL